jgi:hypothetical protein
MSETNEPVSFMQRILDNPFILLFIGIIFPTLIYLVWGIMEIMAVPNAPL